MLVTCGQYVHNSYVRIMYISVGHFVHHSFKGGRTGVKRTGVVHVASGYVCPLILLWCSTFARVKSAACFMGPWHTVQTLSVRLPLATSVRYSPIVRCSYSLHQQG